MRNLCSCFILYRQFLLYSQKRLQTKKSKGRDPELRKIVSCEKSPKMLHTLQKANCRRFTLNRKSVYLSLTCGKQIIIKPVQRDKLSSRTPSFCKPFFRNRRCPLWITLTVLSKLIYNIFFCNIS